MDGQATSFVAATQCDPISGTDSIFWSATVTDNVSCPAKRLAPHERRDLAIQVLAGAETISELAQQHEVSRKFLYQQVHTAEQALSQAFAPPPTPPDKVLFYLPVTQALLRQVVLGLVLICHSSTRGVVEFLRDVLGYRISLGKVHNIVHAVPVAARISRQCDLSRIRIGLLDEIHQGGDPVLVGVDARSTFCFLLSLEEHRDADTWAIRLLELADRGFAPEATVADFAAGLRAGQQEALPGVPCRGDVFHALYTMGPLACSHRIKPVRTMLENQRDNLLAFAGALDRELTALAQEWQISVTIAREVLQVQSLPTWDPNRWRRDAALRETLRGRYHGVCADVHELSDQVVRASSMVENLNSRLRTYFFLRRQLGNDYLTLLQFFLNHRRYVRSEDPNRVGKSPAELLTGQPHAHWLELLGYTRFSKS